MTNFAAFRATNSASFARCKRRHVVVQHETIFIVTGQCINALCITFSAQSGDNQCLSFATRKQRRAVCAWKDAVANFNGANGACVAAVNAGFTGQNLAANNFGFDVKQHAFNSHAVKCNAVGLECSHDV